MAIPPFTSVPIAGVIPFDNSSNGFVSEDVQSAIEEALNGESDDNFSHRVISDGQTVLIKTGQQMLLVGNLIVEGTFIVDGQMIDDEFVDEENFSHKRIFENRKVKVPSGQQMIVDGNMIVEGSLILEGSLSVINDEENQDTLTPYIIDFGKVYKIKSRREFFLATQLYNEGSLINEGRMVIGG